MELCKKNPRYSKSLPFEITQKRVDASYHLPLVVDTMKKYRHKTDGLMFTAENAPYVLGTCDKMLKWKPAFENTVDFKVSMIDDDIHIGICLSDDKYEDVGIFKPESEEY